ncbi:MAG: DUF805 domain-containing protein [Pseudomonadota bacterium]
MNNPYSAPGAALSDVPSEAGTYQPRMFAWKGRIGRLRYLAYLCGITLLTMPLMGIVMALLMPLVASGAKSPALVSGVTMLLYIPLIVLGFALARRRFNDVNRSGWLALLLIVPFVNVLTSLYLVFAAGSDGANDYGPPPSANTAWVKVGALVLPLIFITGILAAVAIPAYQTYQQKATAGASGKF